MQSFAILVSILFVLSLIYILYIKFTQKFSKARFALATLSSITMCLFSVFAATSLNLPSIAIRAIVGSGRYEAEFTGQSWIFDLLAFLFTSLVCYFIYKFACHAVTHWEAPPRVSESELAKDHLQNSIPMLAIKELKRLALNQRDPIASDHIITWDRKVPEPPRSIETRVLLRDLFRARFREAALPENGWRDVSQLWVGDFYVNSNVNPQSLYLLVFAEVPTEKAIKERLEKVDIAIAGATRCRVFAVYMSGRRHHKSQQQIVCNGLIKTYLVPRTLF